MGFQSASSHQSAFALRSGRQVTVRAVISLKEWLATAELPAQEIPGRGEWWSHSSCPLLLQRLPRRPLSGAKRVSCRSKPWWAIPTATWPIPAQESSQKRSARKRGHTTTLEGYPIRRGQHPRRSGPRQYRSPRI